jgi:putative ABC transport system ATP-binding protein
VIELEGVSRVFEVGTQTVHALREVTLILGRGEYVSVMGPSGSGKSTLLHVVGLLDRATSGVYRLDGQDVTGLDDNALARVRRERIGFVFQFFHLVPRLSAAENVELPMTLAGLAPAERRERAAAALAAYGLADRAQHRPDQLSGGQRQRVAIARAVLADPRLLILDEATSSLDSESEGLIQDGLRALRRGRTTFVIAHRLSTIQSADQILVLEGGKVVERGTHAELLAVDGRYRQLYDKQYRRERDRFVNPGEELPEPAS